MTRRHAPGRGKKRCRVSRGHVSQRRLSRAPSHKIQDTYATVLCGMCVCVCVCTHNSSRSVHARIANQPPKAIIIITILMRSNPIAHDTHDDASVCRGVHRHVSDTGKDLPHMYHQYAHIRVELCWGAVLPGTTTTLVMLMMMTRKCAPIVCYYTACHTL